MEKTLGAFDVRRQFGKILQQVSVRGDRVVVERHGEPVAVMVPLPVYEQWKRARKEFFDSLEEMAVEANLTPEEAQELVAREVEAVRAQRG